MRSFVFWGRNSSRSLLGWAWLSVAILSIAMRAIVPAGYMLDRARDGAVAVRLCSDHGVQNAVIDLKTGAITINGDENSPAPKPEGDSKKQLVCPFAGQAPPLAAAAPLQIDAPQRIAIEASKIASAELRVRTWAERPWPTGPPLNS